MTSESTKFAVLTEMPQWVVDEEGNNLQCPRCKNKLLWTKGDEDPLWRCGCLKCGGTVKK